MRHSASTSRTLVSYLLVVGIAMALATLPSLAQQGPGGPGRSVAAAPQAFEAQEQAELEGHRQRTEARRQKLEKLVAPFQRRLDAALKRDKKLAQRMAEFEAAGQAAAEEGISEQEREQRLARLDGFRPFQAEVLEKMGFDQPGFRKQVQEALGLPARGRDDKPPADGREHIVWGEGTSFRIVPAAEPDPSSPVIPRGLLAARTLGAPYPESYTRKRGPAGRVSDGRTIADGLHADRATPGYRASANTRYIGYYTNEAGLGHIETVPRRAARMIVDAALPRANWAVSASPGVGPDTTWAYAKARSLIYVIHNGNIKCRRGYTHREMWNLWGYHFSTGEDNVTLLCAFAAPPPGDKVVVRYRGYATVNITGIGRARAMVEADAERRDTAPKDIRISYYD